MLILRLSIEIFGVEQSDDDYRSVSSTTAIAERKILGVTGTLSPSKYKTPRAKAISVDIGMPQPEMEVRPELMIKDVKAVRTFPYRGDN